MSKMKGASRNAARIELPFLFVLDTNVLMHDPSSPRHFNEHHIFIPLGVVEELDNHKTGLSDIARNVRYVSRWFDELMCGGEGGSSNYSAEEFSRGFLIDPLHPETSGRLFLQSVPDEGDPIVGKELSLEKIDNQIIAITLSLKKKWLNTRYQDIILISKDINVRIKARAFGISAEDYQNDQVIDDAANLFTGITQLPGECFNELKKQSGNESLQTDMPIYAIPPVPDMTLFPNQLIHDGNGFSAVVRGVEGDKIIIQKPRNYTTKHPVLGINARNREQNFIFNLLLDPLIPIVTLLGPAGSGKTLLTIASGLKQVDAPFGDKTYQSIIMTRITIPAGEDIGFFPGTEEEKMGPWMGALFDNLRIISKSYGDLYSGDESVSSVRNHPRLIQTSRKTARSKDPVPIPEARRPLEVSDFRKCVQLPSMITMRGRTFVNSYVIIDEAQNLTPKQVKMLATRVGPGSKMIFLGNLAQIDTPYLTDRSSGLAYLAERFKGLGCYGHAILSEVVRSEVAQLAEELL